MNSSDVPDLSTTFLKTASAVGLRQMFPISHISFMLKIPAGAKKQYPAEAYQDRQKVLWSSSCQEPELWMTASSFDVSKW